MLRHLVAALVATSVFGFAPALRGNAFARAPLRSSAAAPLPSMALPTTDLGEPLGLLNPGSLRILESACCAPGDHAMSAFLEDAKANPAMAMSHLTDPQVMARVREILF